MDNWNVYNTIYEIFIITQILTFLSHKDNDTPDLLLPEVVGLEPAPDVIHFEYYSLK